MFPLVSCWRANEIVNGLLVGNSAHETGVQIPPHHNHGLLTVPLQEEHVVAFYPPFQDLEAHATFPHLRFRYQATEDVDGNVTLVALSSSR